MRVHSAVSGTHAAPREGSLHFESHRHWAEPSARGLPLAGLNDQPHGPLTQLVRILPRCRPTTTLPWFPASHQTGDGSARVCRAPGRAHGTAATNTPCAGQDTRGIEPTTTEAKRPPPPRWRRVIPGTAICQGIDACVGSRREGGSVKGAELVEDRPEVRFDRCGGGVGAPHCAGCGVRALQGEADPATRSPAPSARLGQATLVGARPH
jgi:hypothetical protein